MVKGGDSVMKKVDIKQWITLSIKDPKNAGNKKAAQECADFYNASVVKGFIKKQDGTIQTHYFNKMYFDYWCICVEPNSEYFVEETA